MEQAAIILFLIGFNLFIVFGLAVGNYHQEDKEFEHLDTFGKIEISIFSILALLGAILLITSCILLLICLIKSL